MFEYKINLCLNVILKDILFLNNLFMLNKDFFYRIEIITSEKKTVLYLIILFLLEYFT